VHVPALAPVMAELARVLRPGGHLVISANRLPAPADRPAFAADLRQALGPDRVFTEHVRVTAPPQPPSVTAQARNIRGTSGWVA